MLLATCVDGVVLKSKQKVRATNYREFRDQLENELESDGFVRSFFQGEACTFIYSDGVPCAPSKMVDYDAAFADIAKRPLPFFPNEMKYHYIDKAFKRRVPMYKQMCQDASIIINAATDDIEGEVSFAQFFTIFAGVMKKVYRARPKAMTEAAIIEAFNALEDVYPRAAYATACDYHETMNWLVSCNTSNVLSAHNYERRLIVAGRLESLLLAQISERTNPPKTDAFQVAVTLRTADKKLIHAMVAEQTFSEASKAEKVANDCQEAQKATVVASETHQSVTKIPLLNAFTIQLSAARSSAELTARQTLSALEWLFCNGHITWPSQESSLPWSAKPRFTNAITVLSTREMFQDRVLPRDIDNFLDWDSGESLFEHIGVMVTEKPLPDNAPEDAEAIYNIIAASNIMAIKMRVKTTSSNTSFSCGPHKLQVFSTREDYINLQDAVTRPLPDFEKGNLLEVVSAKVERIPARTSYTEGDLIDDILPVLDGTFCYSAQKICVALENLIAWEQVERTDRLELRLTERGRLAYKYLAGTSLTDPTEVSDWDRRLMTVARGYKDAASNFLEDLRNYIDDLCKELASRAADICAFNGRAPSEACCPVCGAALSMPDEGGCECCNSACSFSIKRKAFGHKMSKLDISNLLTTGKTQLITDFVSKKGQQYAARIVMDASGKTSLSFDALTPCPFCKGDMKEYLWGVRCYNDSCGFSLNTTVCGHRLSEQELRLILTHQTTNPLRLTNSSGKVFVASLSLNPDKSLKFTFPERGK